LVLAVGDNGAGKTNLLEALHVGTQGFSPRSRTDAQLVRFGADAARIELAGDRGGVKLEVELTLRPGEAKRAQLNGAPLRAAEQLRAEVATLVFTPDRLVVVKGGPAARRAYFDRALGRLFPARAGLPAEYAGTVAQRNAALRRVTVGVSSREAVTPWTQQVAELGAALVGARHEAIDLLSPVFAERADELGLPGADLLYEAEPPTAGALEARLDEDLDRGTTGLGPHLDDVGIAASGRDLRRFGSQGEQRLAVLSLLLGEAELLTERGPAPPLLLLDDVLSELDERRRRALADRLAGTGQAFVTATGASALPIEPAQLIAVVPGSAR
jgi:DNA replication and repair protein RecF